ncbi:MAG: quinolinate synthase NadA [Chloroflexi bacterium]|nr:quinolinate synthase NadA [Chloroflexota bacterium]MCI0792556.1 quinolinate synthase NadA [Chloroflexota bacterium]MCI0823993.1 quinolinate synthase NadA [Chloroflexota bacterium]MCI0858586.1 quinolinate synthase NadA [Chloroflexota bacterium]MCI0866674.1 quinolinate synthase NadA [Chloroflexota bacterium]
MVTRTRQPTIPITEIEHAAFCKPEDELPAKSLAEEMSANVRWQKISTDYLHMSAEELDQRIHVTREKLGESVTVLGHHYQREEIIKYVDFQGDSFLLSQEAANRPEADYIVFCGVHFMAETACILCADHQKVILPNITAGCSMADMAPMDDVDDAWEDLQSVLGDHGGIVPVTYMNSIAGIKALCGRNNGAVCTSSNAPAVMEWGYQNAERILFLPDQHLGRNTGLKLGLSTDDMVVWNPFKRFGGNTPEQLRNAKLILWQGHCAVHTRFTVKQIEVARERYPDVTVLVHPECTMETVQAADMNGSTEFIRKAINEAPAGSKWAVGTEISLVNRLALSNPDKTVFCLDPVTCPCSTMYRIHPAYLLWVLDGLLEGQVINQITVPDQIQQEAQVALNRMLALK